MQGNTATRTVVALMILIVLTCVVAVAQQPKNLTRPDVFAIFNGPREPFEALMKDVDAALAKNLLNPYARFLHGVGLSRRSLEAIERQDFKAATELWQHALTARNLAPDNEKMIASMRRSQNLSSGWIRRRSCVCTAPPWSTLHL